MNTAENNSIEEIKNEIREHAIFQTTDIELLKKLKRYFNNMHITRDRAVLMDSHYMFALILEEWKERDIEPFYVDIKEIVENIEGKNKKYDKRVFVYFLDNGKVIIDDDGTIKEIQGEQKKEWIPDIDKIFEQHKPSDTAVISMHKTDFKFLEMLTKFGESIEIRTDADKGNVTMRTEFQEKEYGIKAWGNIETAIEEIYVKNWATAKVCIGTEYMKMASNIAKNMETTDIYIKTEYPIVFVFKKDTKKYKLVVAPRVCD